MPRRVWCSGTRWGAVPADAIRAASACGPTGLALYCALAAHADGDGDAYPSRDLLAETVGVSPGSVSRSLRRLVDAELVDVRPRLVGGRKVGNVYRLRELDGSHRSATSVGGDGSRRSATDGSRRSATSLEEGQTNEQKAAERPVEDVVTSRFFDWYRAERGVSCPYPWPGVRGIVRDALREFSRPEVGRALRRLVNTGRPITKPTVWDAVLAERQIHARSERHDEVAALQALNERTA